MPNRDHTRSSSSRGLKSSSNSPDPKSNHLSKKQRSSSSSTEKRHKKRKRSSDVTSCDSTVHERRSQTNSLSSRHENSHHRHHHLHRHHHHRRRRGSHPHRRHRNHNYRSFSRDSHHRFNHHHRKSYNSKDRSKKSTVAHQESSHERKYYDASPTKERLVSKRRYHSTSPSRTKESTTSSSSSRHASPAVYQKRHCSKASSHSLTPDAHHHSQRSSNSQEKHTTKENSSSKKTNDAKLSPTNRSNKKSKWDVPFATDIGPGLGLPGSAAYCAVLTPPLEDRRGRRLYIGNLPPGISEAAVIQFFNGALLATAGVDYSVAAASGQFPALKAEYLPEHRYCFLEFRTVADASICLKLDGISFNGYMLKIGRPNDYTATPIPQEMSTSEALSTGQLVSQFAKLVPETKMYVTDLPLTITDQELRQKCEEYGVVKSAALMKDLRTGQSMGCGIVEFEETAALEAAIANLDGKPMNDRTPRFTKGPLVPPTVSKLLETARRSVIQTSSIVTELPTSMTHKILSNALIGAQVQAARRDGSTPSQVVQLLNCVYPEDLIKDEDYNSILEDIKKEASEYGTVLNVIIPRPPSDLSFQPGVGKVFIHFADLTAARKAQCELNGRRFEERRVVCAAFYPLERFVNSVYTVI